MSARASEGRCLCGSVTLKAELPHSIGVCHCSMCRRWASGPFMAMHLKAPPQVAGDTVGTFVSSDWAERSFCTKCGSNLWYRFRPNDEYIVNPWLFEDTAGLPLGDHVYVDEKPENYEMTPVKRALTEADILAMYAPKED